MLLNVAATIAKLSPDSLIVVSAALSRVWGTSRFRSRDPFKASGDVCWSLVRGHWITPSRIEMRTTGTDPALVSAAARLRPL